MKKALTKIVLTAGGLAALATGLAANAFADASGTQTTTNGTTQVQDIGCIGGLNCGPINPPRPHPPRRAPRLNRQTPPPNALHTAFTDGTNGTAHIQPAGTISGLNGGGLMPQQRKAIEQRKRLERQRQLQRQQGPASFQTGNNSITLRI